MSKHRAPRRLGRRAATPVAALALSAAALTAVAPMASAHTRTHGDTYDNNNDNGDVGLINHTTLLPVQACGTQVPILSGILGGNSDHASCAQQSDH